MPTGTAAAHNSKIMAPSTEYIILDLLCPSLGVILATMTFAAPVRSLRERLTQGSLGDLNPTPWAVMTGNCAGWIAYSYLTKDLFVLFANVPGLMVSIWLNLGAIKLQYRTTTCDISSPSPAAPTTRNGVDVFANDDDVDVDVNDHHHNHDDAEIEMVPSTVPHERKVLWVILFWVAVCSLVAHVEVFTNYEREQIVGCIVNLNLCFFYFAPLTTIVEVCRTQSSASIHRPTTIMTILNSFFWSAYGFAVRDPFIYVPNGVGLGFGVMQAALLLLFGSKRARGRDDARETLLNAEGMGDGNEGRVGGGDDSTCTGTGTDRFDHDGIEGGLV